MILIYKTLIKKQFVKNFNKLFQNNVTLLLCVTINLFGNNGYDKK